MVTSDQCPFSHKSWKGRWCSGDNVRKITHVLIMEKVTTKKPCVTLHDKTEFYLHACIWIYQPPVCTNVMMFISFRLATKKTSVMHYWLFVKRIHHQRPVDSPHKGPENGKCFCHDFIMTVMTAKVACLVTWKKMMVILCPCNEVNYSWNRLDF